jgi:hypothetical protein
MDKQAIQSEALSKAVSGQSLTNYPSIIQGFIDKGIAPDNIRPRENVFTFNAWKALGRSVRKGEHGVKVLTFIVTKDKTTDQVNGKRPWSTTVFHVTQTDSIQ